jgi:hypothetical protein
VARCLLPMLAMLRLAVLALLGGCFPYGLPPLKGELGATTQTNRSTAGRVAGGAHLASGTLRRDQPFDIGAGAFYEWDEIGTRAKGAYGDVALFVDRGARTRTSLGLRGELRYDEMSRAGMGAKLRIDHEIYGATTAPYSGADGCSMIVGGAHGTGAIGLYVEAGSAWMPDTDRAFVATAGITVRIPATAGLIIGIPGC